MTVSNTITKLQYSGDGSNRQFGVTFPLLSAAHLRIVVTDENGAETEIVNNFSVSPQLNSVTYPTVESGLNPLPNGKKITLIRNTPLTQEIDLQTGGALDAKELEGGYDKAVLVAQELAAALDRAVKVPISSLNSETNAQEYLNAINAGVSSATEQAELAENAAQQAASSAQSAQEKAEETTEKAQIAQQYAAAALNSQNNAAASASAALNSAGNAAQSAEEAQSALADIMALKRTVLTFTAGTPSESYDGGLKTFNIGTDLTYLAVVPYVNGQRKDEGEYTLSGTSVVFNYNLRNGDRVVFEINSSILTAEAADVDAEISAHNSAASAHPALDARISALENSGTGGGGTAEQYSVAQNGTWTANYLNTAHKNYFRSGNLGISGKTITKVEILLGNGTDGSPHMIFPCLTGWGDQSGNFVDIYHQFPSASWDFTEWFTDTSNIPYEIRVYYK